jgi:hypothetical protein
LHDSIELGASRWTQALESATAVQIGIAGGWNWANALKNNRLLLPEVADQYAYRLRYRTPPAPITAIMTILFSFVGMIL